MKHAKKGKSKKKAKEREGTAAAPSAKVDLIDACGKGDLIKVQRALILLTTIEKHRLRMLAPTDTPRSCSCCWAEERTLIL
jgi:hypothetical protein